MEVGPNLAALAQEIKNVNAASEQLSQSHEPLREIEKIKGRATTAEATDLRQAIAERRRSEAERRDAWITSGAKGPRPEPDPELPDLESRLGAIAAEAAAIAPKLAAAERGVVAASAAVREATVRRDQAVAAAAVESATITLNKLTDSIRSAMAVEAKLWGLVDALYEAANRDENTKISYLGAADRLIQAIKKATNVTVRKDVNAGRRLLESLCTDPNATLE